MKRKLTNTAPKLPGLVPTYSQVRARQGQAGVNEVMARLYHIAKDRFKTPQQISAALKNCVINNSAILSQPDAGSAFAEAFVMMIPKSDLGMTPHDIKATCHELEQQAPYEMRMALMRCNQNGFDGFLTKGIARYQAATGKQVALNTMDLFNGVNDEVVGGEIVNGLSLSVQIALARTSKSQYNIFQQVMNFSRCPILLRSSYVIQRFNNTSKMAH